MIEFKTITPATLTRMWHDVVVRLQPEFAGKELIFEAFLKDSKALFIVDANLYVEVPSSIAKDILNRDWLNLINSISADVLQTNIKVELILATEAKVLELTRNSQSIQKNGSIDGINEELTSDNLVIGDFNVTAHSALSAIAVNPGKRWNPLFIYGPTGLGKTHMSNATAIDHYKKFPNHKVKFISSEGFTREIYESIRKGGEAIENLKIQYSQIDFMVIDDVQFLANKEKTNEIFFNIFNDFIARNKHIVMTCDKRPEQLNGFEERMVSRFASGLTVEITYPEDEILPVILRNKIAKSDIGFDFDSAAIDYIAKVFNNDIRKLEGALQRVYFYAVSMLKPEEKITEEVCYKIFDTEASSWKVEKTKHGAGALIAKICHAYGVDEKLVRSKTRINSVANVRYICMYALREKANLTYQQIGAEFGNRDHSTVMSAIKNVEKSIKNVEKYGETLKNVLSKL